MIEKVVFDREIEVSKEDCDSIMRFEGFINGVKFWICGLTSWHKYDGKKEDYSGKRFGSEYGNILRILTDMKVVNYRR